jgi:5'-nucleotidase
MVAALNAAGVDYATFGNHEFDISEDHFHKRIAGSGAVWFSGNVRDKNGKPFDKVPESVVFTVRGAKGAKVRIGLLGATLNVNSAQWVTYLDAVSTLQQQAKELRPKVDVLLAVTHQTLEDDQRLATTVPGLDLILGGHEHENWELRRGSEGTPIFKADDNVRSVYVHHLLFDTKTHKLQLTSVLQTITDKMPEDPATAKVVKAWTEKAYAAFRANGFSPEEPVATATELLDGKDGSVRKSHNRLTQIIADAILHEWPKADAALYNAGSIRIDDEIPAGSKITQYDVLRILPFGGKINGVELKGSLLENVLNIGQSNAGSGGFLQTANIQPDGAHWKIAGQPIDPEKIYRIALDEFLLTGKEKGLRSLKLGESGVGPVVELRDIRLALIDELKSMK